MQAAVYGLAGPALEASERDFFADCEPAGFILFGRNIVDRVQLRSLTDDLRSLSGRSDLPILIDQEGGRVARMRPPEWPAFPPGEAFARLYDRAPSSAIEAARSNGRALALMLREVGINVNCLPLLDVRQPGAHDIIGDRALGSAPMQVAALGRALLDGMASAGVVGVIKHIPGHGRALADSHVELPVVDASAEQLEIDLEPFRTLKNAPMAMVAHVLYPAWDPDHPASQSRTVIGDIIRSQIGFDNLLISDDSAMNALTGSPGERAAACVRAGCDIALPCDGKLANNLDVAAHIPEIDPTGRERLDRAMAVARAAVDGPELAEMIAKRDELLALA